MKIISNYSDFYDAAMGHGQDSTHVFERYNSTSVRSDDTTWVKKSNDQVVQSLHGLGKNDRQTLEQIVQLEQDEQWDTLVWLFANLGVSYEQRVSGTIPRLLKAAALINGKMYHSYSLVERAPQDNPKTDPVKVKLVQKGISKQECLTWLQKNASSWSHAWEDLKGASLEDLGKIRKKNPYRYYSSYKAVDLGTDVWDDRVTERFAPLLQKVHQMSASPIVLFTSDARVDLEYRDARLQSTQPIISGYDINTMVPLSVLGFGKTLKGQIDQVYQEIDFCMHNVIKNKGEPPVALTDKEKIEQYGFDKKTSFRHPVKLKK